jgi:aspartyl-tRNA synthetase
VRARPEGTENHERPTGLIEVYVHDFEVLGPADDLPLPVFGDQEYPEETRLTYRFLDLRRERLHRNLMTRGRSSTHPRAHEGGRLLRVPDADPHRLLARGRARLPGAVAAACREFYALPQAPQQFKQLIMVAGFDRYFQIAPCFRDEDPAPTACRASSTSSTSR